MRINVSPTTTEKVQVNAVAPLPSASARSCRAPLMFGVVSVKIILLH